MSNDGQCMQCGQSKPMFLHKIFHRSLLQVCTSCLLKLNPGKFCPICFHVYTYQDLTSSSSSSRKLVRCCFCDAKAHPECAVSDLASSSSSSSSAPREYICKSCSTSNFNFFDCRRDEVTGSAFRDELLGPQLVAAAIISQQSMEETAVWSRKRAEVKAAEAARARREATKALERLADLTMTSPPSQSGEDEEMEDSDESEEEGEEGSQEGEEWEEDDES